MLQGHERLNGLVGTLARNRAIQMALTNLPSGRLGIAGLVSLMVFPVTLLKLLVAHFR
jgi:hypothetical protein